MSIIERDGEIIVTSTQSKWVIPEVTIGEFVANKIATFDPKLVALIDPETDYRITFGEIDQTSRRFATSLLKLGLTHEDLVLYFGDNSIQYAIATLATVYLGLSYSPVTPANGPYEFSKQVANSKGSVLVIDKDKMPILLQAFDNHEYAITLSQIKLLVVINQSEVEPKLLQHPACPKLVLTYDQVFNKSTSLLQHVPHFPAKPDDTLLIIYTSGSTGLPKGAIHTHRTFINGLLNWNLWKPRPEAAAIVSSSWSPMGHISGSRCLWHDLYHGFTTILHRDLSTEKLMAAVHKYKSQWLRISAVHFVPLAKGDYEKRYDLSSLKLIWHGGSKIPENLINEIKAKLTQIRMIEKYGSTEFMGSVYNTHLKDAKLGNLGSPCSGVEMKIVHVESGQSLPSGQRGEICFRGPPCFIGYLGNEEATRKTIDEAGWYHSGDVGYFDEQGCLFMVDRIKELIKYKMWSLFPAEIEDFLQQHPSVASVCVVGVKHATDGHLIRAYVQLRPNHQVTAEKLVKHVQDNLGFQKRLRGGVYFVTQMPRTSIGKIDRQHFKRLVKDELITKVVE